MDNTEHVFRTLGKFLAIASAVRIYKEIYSGDIPQIEIIQILNDLQVISDDYLYPKYILENNNLLKNGDINNYDEEDFLNDIGH